MGHHEGRGHDLEAEHPLRRRLLHPRPGEGAQALAPQVGGDALEGLGQVCPGAAAGIEDVDVLGGQSVLDAQVVLQGAVHAGHHVAHHLGRVYQTPSCLRRAGSKASRNGS